MMARTGDGSTRTAALDTKTSGSDTVSFDSGNNGIVIDHRGPPTSVNLTLSSTGRSTLPVTVKTKVKVAGNAKTTLKPASWKDLLKGQLSVRSKGHVRKVRLRRTRGRGAKVTGVTVKKGVAHVRVSVPSSVETGTATVSLLVRRGRRAVGSLSRSAGGPGTRTLTFKLPAKGRRGDRIVAAVTTLLVRGLTFDSTLSHRQAKVR